MKGVFDLVGTHGLPLEIALEGLKSRGAMPDWLDYWTEATKGGAKPAGVRFRLSNAVMDVYGKEFHDPWLEMLDKIIDHRNRHP